jgi:hypothetical protein
MAVAVDLGFDFLHLSTGGKAMKALADQLAQRIVKNVDGKIREMSEEEILTQVLYVRDEIIPYLLGQPIKKEELHDETPEDKHTG